MQMRSALEVVIIGRNNRSKRDFQMSHPILSKIVEIHGRINYDDDTINVTKVVARKSILMQITKAKAGNLYR